MAKIKSIYNHIKDILPFPVSHKKEIKIDLYAQWCHFVTTENAILDRR